MWIFTTKGFYSAVEHTGNPGWIHLRARFKGDLERLLEAHKGLVTDAREQVGEIRHTPSADYRYRVDIRRELFAQIVAAECMAINYSNFKSSCPANGFEGRHSAYLDVWCAMRRSQDTARRREK